MNNKMYKMIVAIKVSEINSKRDEKLYEKVQGNTSRDIQKHNSAELAIILLSWQIIKFRKTKTNTNLKLAKANFPKLNAYDKF